LVSMLTIRGFGTMSNRWQQAVWGAHALARWFRRLAEQSLNTLGTREESPRWRDTINVRDARAPQAQPSGAFTLLILPYPRQDDRVLSIIGDAFDRLHA
jgi:hypothetical protein